MSAAPEIVRYPDVMTVLEAAAYLRISRSALDKMLRDNTIPSFKVCRIVRIRRADLDELFK
jgi:excisionase family DNA binding protein